MNEEEMLAKIDELTTANESLTKELESSKAELTSTKERLDKANALSQELISRYALKEDSTKTSVNKELSLEERIKQVLNKGEK